VSDWQSTAKAKHAWREIRVLKGWNHPMTWVAAQRGFQGVAFGFSVPAGHTETYRQIAGGRGPVNAAGAGFERAVRIVALTPAKYGKTHVGIASVLRRYYVGVCVGAGAG